MVLQVFNILFNIDTDCKFEEFNNTDILTNDTRCNGFTNYSCASGYTLTSGNLSRVCGIGRQWMVRNFFNYQVTRNSIKFDISLKKSLFLQTK